MEEQRRSNRNSNSNTNSNVNSSSGSNEDVMMGCPVHSQVRKIKQESKKVVDITDYYWTPAGGQPQLELKSVLRDMTARRLSRSPLGICRPISVGN